MLKNKKPNRSKYKKTLINRNEKGIRHGKYIKYFPSIFFPYDDQCYHNIEEIGQYVNGKKSGLWIYYKIGPNNTVIEKVKHFYSNGIIITTPS